MKLRIAGKADVPLYRRIADAVCDASASGRLAPGEKLPSESALAAELKVSRPTVSRAYEYLETRGVVLQKRGSGTYLAAHAPIRTRSRGGRPVGNLAVVLGEDSLSKCRRETLFILTDILEGIDDVLGQREYSRRLLKSLTRQSLDGLMGEDAVVHMESREPDGAIAQELLGRGIRVVTSLSGRGGGVPHVYYSRYRSGALACRYLVECAYTRIGYVGVKAQSDPRMPVCEKFIAFTDVLHQAGLDVVARHVREASVTPGHAYKAACDILQSGGPPEAFFVDTDYKAMEVIHALNSTGIRVPEDVGVVAYDDVPDAAAFTPPLTTVRVPRREIGRRIARLLLEWSDDGKTPGDVTVESQLVVRGSTAGRSP